MKPENNIRLWQRDYRILDDLSHAPMTTSQVARLHFPSVKKAAERLKLPHDEGLIKRFPNTQLAMQGKPEFQTS